MAVHVEAFVVVAARRMNFLDSMEAECVKVGGGVRTIVAGIDELVVQVVQRAAPACMMQAGQEFGLAEIEVGHRGEEAAVLQQRTASECAGRLRSLTAIRSKASSS